MKHHDQVADAFGSTAAAYLTSPTHASGADLETLAAEVGSTPNADVLDLGCGAGHASFAAARHARSVIAYDLAAPMLATVAASAKERGLSNIRTEQGSAERLPFDDASFDWVVSRLSAHHWHDVPRALAEVRFQARREQLHPQPGEPFRELHDPRLVRHAQDRPMDSRHGPSFSFCFGSANRPHAPTPGGAADPETARQARAAARVKA